MESQYWQLKDQLREYGLSPNEWRWKVILPEQQEGVLENRQQVDLTLVGKWSATEASEKWNYLEWQI